MEIRESSTKNELGSNVGSWDPSGSVRRQKYTMSPNPSVGCACEPNAHVASYFGSFPHRQRNDTVFVLEDVGGIGAKSVPAVNDNSFVFIQNLLSLE